MRGKATFSIFVLATFSPLSVFFRGMLMMGGKATTFSIFVLATFSPLSLSKPQNDFHYDYGLNVMSPKGEDIFKELGWKAATLRFTP